MEQTLNNQLPTNRYKGAALLVVLFIVMAITILSLGFLSRSDVELACGRNMVLRTQIDYLADSGLEHARGLILNPQDVDSEYWTGADAQQLIAGSVDYYDLAVVRDDLNPSDRCNYTIDCNAYRLEGGERIGRSEIRAQLRLDPCIALWSGNDMTVWDGTTVYGDVYCNGTLINAGAIDGDAFAHALSGNNISGQVKSVADLSLSWPRVTVADFTTNYTTLTISTGTISGQTFGPYDPVRVCYRNGALVLAGNVRIEGMLIVNGDLSIQGIANSIIAAKKCPALFVTGDLIVGSNGDLDIEGLAVIDGGVRVSAGDANINILGGLFVQGNLLETTSDSSSNDNKGTIVGATWTPVTDGYALNFDGVDDYVKIDANPSLDNLGAITMTARIYPREDSHWHVLDKGEGDKRLYAEGVERTLNGLIRYSSMHANSGGVSNTIVLNSWQHVALTWDQATNTTRLFHNGIEVQYNFQDIGSGSMLDDTTHPFIIGARGGLQDITFFNGLIDDVRIYDRVLDVNDIPPPEGLPGLIGHWKMDEGGRSRITITAAPAKTAVEIWSQTGDVEKWGQAVGAFYRSIKRR
jgi:hypothetical protein